MTPSSVYTELALAALLLLLGSIGGYWVADTLAGRTIEGLNKQLAQAKADTAVAVAAVDATRTALGALKGKLDALQTRHDAMRTLGEAELAARAQRIDQLQRDAARRQSALVEKGRDATCAELARLPVCAAVAGQLWPAAGEAAGGQPPGNH